MLRTGANCCWEDRAAARADVNVPTFIPARPPRRRRKRRNLPTAGPLVLVAATYDVNVPSLRLSFDRAIDISAFNGSAVVVDDSADSGNAYVGTGGAFHVGANALEIFLVDPTPATGSGTTLSAAADNGIVALAPPVGAAWAGVTELALPYP